MGTAYTTFPTVVLLSLCPSTRLIGGHQQVPPGPPRGKQEPFSIKPPTPSSPQTSPMPGLISPPQEMIPTGIQEGTYSPFASRPYVQVWRGDVLCTWAYASTVIQEEREKLDPQTGRRTGQEIKSTFAPMGLKIAGLNDHVTVLYQRVKGGLELFYCNQGGKPESQGRLQGTDALRPLAIIPLEDRRLMLALPFGGAALPVAGRFSPLVVIKRREQGDWEATDAVDLALDLFDEAKLKAGPKVPSASVLKPGRGLAWQDILVPVLLQAGAFPVMYLPRTGRLISLNPTDGTVRQNTLVYPSVLVPEHRNKQKEVALIGASATRDGKLVVATRTEDAVLHAREIFQADLRSKGKLPAEVFQKEVDQATASALEAFPEVHYWEWDPDTGHIHRIPVPEGLPSKLRRFKDLASFRLRASVDGEVREDGIRGTQSD